jgi:DNA-binding transcriptional ArsR family regulator
VPNDKNDSDSTDTRVKAIAHELRRRIIKYLVARGDQKPASPREVADALGRPLANVSYHVRVLADCEAITLVDTNRVRGAVEHFYCPSEEFLKVPFIATVLGLGPTGGAV